MAKSRIKQEHRLPEAPFVLTRTYSFGPPEPCIAILELGDGYFCLEHYVGLGHLDLSLVKKAEIGGIQYKLCEEPVQERLAAFKAKALERGATLEAIQLLGHGTPLTKEEELTMAEAGTKLSRKTADKEGLKAAAKAAPVKGKAPKGNPEALAKARAARAEGASADRTYKVLAKENPGREGTWTHAMMGHIMGATSTDDAKASLAKDRQYKDRKLDFGWAEKKGHIKF